MSTRRKKCVSSSEGSSKLLNPSPRLLCSPRGPMSKEKVDRKKIETGNNIPGEKIHPYNTRSKACLHKAHKRKTKPSDSEVTIPRRTHFRGQVKRGQTTNTSQITNERGKLDTATFHRYFMHVWSAVPVEKLESVTYFDPLWFKSYASANSRANVLKWIKKKHIFSKKYVFVPIVMWSHWSLLIFCHLDEDLDSEANGPCMLLLDSSHSIGSERLEPLIRSLLFDMYKSEEKVESKQELKKTQLFIPEVPQQKNGDECGFYILYFLKLFLESAPEVVNISEGYPHFMKKDWFNAEEVESFCKSLDDVPLVSDHGDTGESDSGDSVEFVESSFPKKRA